MVVGNSLTNLQKVAIRGEVAYAVSTATHNAEVKYRIYTILKEVEDKYKPFLIEAFKEAVTFDEWIVDKLYLETLTNEVPVWLWIEKVIADMKESLYLTEATSISRASVNKVAERKKIIESAFVNFGRKALITSVEAAEQLFDEVLEDNDLSFLHTSCFYLRSSCEEMRDSGKVQDKVPEDLLECCFDIRDMLSIKIETEALEVFNNDEFVPKFKPKKKIIKKTEKISISPDMTEEDIKELVNQKMMSLFMEDFKENKPKKQFKYVVNKVFNNTQISTTIRVCDTQEEAEQFIKEIKRVYPELQNTCEFIISKERKDGK